MKINKAAQQFVAKKEFHKENAKLSYEEKVAQIIELQKIGVEFDKHKKGPKSPIKRVWFSDKP